MTGCLQNYEEPAQKLQLVMNTESRLTGSAPDVGAGAAGAGGVGAGLGVEGGEVGEGVGAGVGAGVGITSSIVAYCAGSDSLMSFGTNARVFGVLCIVYA